MENTQTEMDIRELVEQASGGNREAIAAILKKYTSDMYFVTRLYVGDKDTARSSEQAALRTALRSLKNSASAESFEDWLTDIVRNTALSNIPEVTINVDPDLKYTNKDEIPNTRVQLPEDGDECKIRILHALDSLPSSERAAAAMRYYDLASLDEISEKLNISKNDTRKLLASAKQILAEGDTAVSVLLALASKVNPKLSFDEEALKGSDNILEADDMELDDLFEITAAAEKLNDVDLEFKEDSDAADAEEEPDFGMKFNEPQEFQDEEEDLFSDISFNQEPAQEPEKKKPIFDIPEEVDPEPTKVVESIDQVIYPAADDDDDYDEPKRKKGGFLKWFLPLLLIAALAGGAFYLFGIKGYTFDDIMSLFNRDGAKPAETVTPEPTVEPTETPEPTTTPTPAPTPVPTPETPAYIGQAYTNVSDLTIRNGAGINFEYVDLAQAETTYDVYETAEADGYTWYRISENGWIPSEGTWITYTPKQ